jgi:hypothetical protein
MTCLMWNDICLINAHKVMFICNCVWLLSYLVNRNAIVLVLNGYMAGVLQSGTCTTSCDVCLYNTNPIRIEENFPCPLNARYQEPRL